MFTCDGDRRIFSKQGLLYSLIYERLGVNMNKLMVRPITRVLTSVAALSVIGVLLVVIIHFPIIPAAPFLEVDFGDVPAMLAAFAFSPLLGLLTVAIASLIQALTVSAGSGSIGFFMHVCASGVFILTAGFIFHRFRNFKAAVVGLVTGALLATAVMIPLNLILTPIFMGVDRAIVMRMLVPAIIPFNLIKYALNAILVLALYKPVRFLLIDKFNAKIGKSKE